MEDKSKAEKQDIRHEKNSTPVNKLPLSKLLINGGVKPVIIKKTVKEKIVLHPRRKMRFETKTADELLKKYSYLKEVK